MNFLKNVLAAIMGCLVAFGLLLGMFFIFLALFKQRGNMSNALIIC